MYCDCYDTETGELLDADPRQNLKQVVSDFEKELGLSFLIEAALDSSYCSCSLPNSGSPYRP